MLWIIISIIVIFIIAIILIYNNLVTLRMRVKNAWSQIDIQLQRRFDLIPNLVETVKAYATHEQETLEKITELRASWVNASTVIQKADLDNQLTKSIGAIIAVSERYPNLKANSNFMELQNELSNTENKISLSRQFYNDTVTIYNTKLQVFPFNIFAHIFSFLPEDLFKVENEDIRKNINVNF